MGAAYGIDGGRQSEETLLQSESYRTTFMGCKWKRIAGSSYGSKLVTCANVDNIVSFRRSASAFARSLKLWHRLGGDGGPKSHCHDNGDDELKRLDRTGD